LTPLKVRMKFDSDSFEYEESNEISVVFSNISDYEMALKQINRTSVLAVNLQHEFKIFGAKDGENILHLIEGLDKPLLTTFHTVNPELPENRKSIFLSIANRSDLIYIFSKRAKDILCNTYSISSHKVKIIPHGVPNITFCLPHYSKFRKKLDTKIVFVSAGHLRESKGIEIALFALHKLKIRFTNFKYLIIGANHPKNQTAEQYREHLNKLIIELELENHVVFVNQYLPIEDLIEYIQASDIALVPYTRKEQSSSGILSLFMACGRPIVSTNFQYAVSEVEKDNGILAEINNENNFYSAIEHLTENVPIREHMMRANYLKTKKWTWDTVAAKYYEGIKELS